LNSGDDPQRQNFAEQAEKVAGRQPPLPPPSQTPSPEITTPPTTRRCIVWKRKFAQLRYQLATNDPHQLAMTTGISHSNHTSFLSLTLCQSNANGEEM